MAKSQLEFLVLYQDIYLMLQDALEEEKNAGFPVKGAEELKKARDDIARSIEPRYLRIYHRLNTRYKFAISPVKENTCLRCCAKLPTSYTSRGRDDQEIFTCEQCGRILYWIE
jgi:predicted  nucleic acid-binding Zn-ribbon protein